MDESTKFFLSLFSLIILCLLSREGIASHHDHHHFQPTKLFVFGDSYVDTGNTDDPKFPYGITSPGKPDGRFSDGRVLTDLVASLLGLESPIPFTKLKNEGFNGFNDGINFAFAGTGVFDTPKHLPNMTTQIDYFRQLIDDSVLTGEDITSSLALISVSGNDYFFYLSKNDSSTVGFKPPIISIVKQMTVDMKRIRSLGVKKIVTISLGPMGCVPRITTSSSFKQCNATLNLLVDFHNQVVKQAVAKLNRESKDSSISILDMHGAFLSIIHNKGSITFEKPLKPCCFGVSPEFSCGSVDENGKKKYVLCKDPKSSFFWDAVHPTQEGWNAALSSLIPLDFEAKAYLTGEFATQNVN